MKRLVLLLMATFLYGGVWAQACDPYYIFGQADVDNFTATEVCDLIIEYSTADPYATEITNLNGLSELTFVEGDLVIYDNDYLNTLNGLENLDTILGDLQISYHFRLESLSGLNNLKYIGGNVIIIDNDDLSNFEGLNGLTYIGSDFEVGGLSAVSDRGNDELINFSGLNNLTYIGGDVLIQSNQGLENLSGLESLTSINNRLDILENPLLTSLSGLDNLTSTGSVRILFNHSLSSVTALQNLTSVVGVLGISESDLTSLSGLENIDHTGITSLWLSSNPKLSVCNVLSVCNYLENPETTTINDNAPNCNSAAEIEAACLVPIFYPENAPNISFSPNPNFGKFEVKGITQSTYQIYDTKGRIIQSGELENDAFIDISRENQGVYFISFFIDNQIYTKKIIKM